MKWHIAEFVLILLYRMSATAQCSPADSSPMCEKLDEKLFPTCSKVYNVTIRIPKETNISQASLAQPAETSVRIIMSELQNCSAYSQLILCSFYGLPKCAEGVRHAVLPCRSVCYQFLEDCRQHVLRSSLGLSRFVRMCNVLQYDVDDPNDCIKPTGFKPTFKEPFEFKPPLKCEKLNISECRGEGYAYSTRKPLEQRGFAEMDAWKEVIGNNHTECSPKLKKMLCLDAAEPCFPDEPMSMYTICPDDCKATYTDECLDSVREGNVFKKGILNKNFSWFCYAGNSHLKRAGLCKTTIWPRAVLWDIILGPEVSTAPLNAASLFLVLIIFPVVVGFN